MADHDLKEINRLQLERDRAVAVIDDVIKERDDVNAARKRIERERDEFRARWKIAREYLETLRALFEHASMSDAEILDAVCDLSTDVDRFLTCLPSDA